ncbi:nucleotide-binding protein [Herbiconiux moechotypicola]|uniref:CD-NTase-associated protein 12/Pycsar effector protein TIR domain-containing protein n=1 Tax=Herbiconiux moechotypicola TaxID=637393 RepID=A0ABN3D7S5_9MICO|nr:nucleotide-binding protein [Herbiconiux moechotypicola]MCS5728488.1 nucleotide-binding protein [Herbiconiux moechotypicola]
MTIISFRVQGVRLNPGFVADAESTARPFAVAWAQSVIDDSLANTPEDDPLAAGYRQSWADLIDSGRIVRWSTWRTRQRNGVERTTEFDARLRDPDRRELADCDAYSLVLNCGNGDLTRSIPVTVRFTSSIGAPDCLVEIDAPAEQIDLLTEAVTELLTRYIDPALVATDSAFKVFVGHGADPQWKYLVRALDSQDGVRAEAFESDQRAGYHTLVVVDKMIRSSVVAVVVLTGEDEMPDGSRRARENVIHELGYCQGVLGIENVIVLLENGVSEPSNILGLTQIRFTRGALIDVEADVIQALGLRRKAHEFAQAR